MPDSFRIISPALALFLAAAAGDTRAQVGSEPLSDPWSRAVAVEKAMTPDERVVLTSGVLALDTGGLPEDAVAGAGYVHGITRLGIPSLRETDAGLGVSWALGARGGAEGATALPSGMALASAWNPDLAYRAGRMIGAEARWKGFNVLLAGGVNLVRDPRGGRNFEYLSEDPLLSGILGGQSIAGIQSNHIISTVKHFAFNNQETARKFADVTISEKSARESELLAFQMAIEIGRPGAVMCGYNRVNGPFACNSDWLLNRILKRDWGYRGFVMSDWGAVYGPDYAWSGLDHQSGRASDPEIYFAERLSRDAAGSMSRAERISDMNRRILYAIYANRLDSHPVQPGEPVDRAAHARLAEEVAAQGIVLLRNQGGVLPLGGAAKRIAVIGGFADIGVLSGGGSSQVHGDGGPAAVIPGGGRGMFNGWEQYQKGTPPLQAIRERAGDGVTVTFRSGSYVSEAVAEARKADTVILFANQWQTEGRDNHDLSLPRGQDALIEAVTAANPRTIVVLQTGSAIVMPWLDRTAGVVEAWYPGLRGGEAIAAVLFGDVNPSGRLPVTFPASVDQLPRPTLDGLGVVDPDRNGAGEPDQALRIDYDIEGSDLGYRWNASRGQKALFPFGFGLSYTRFALSGLKTDGHTATAMVANTGERRGATVAQLYLLSRNGAVKQRLVGFQRIEIAAGARAQVTFEIDPRLLADWTGDRWTIAAGEYRFALGENAEALGPAVTVRMKRRHRTP